MTDYSAQLARILAYVGLPACEEPMREATDGPYITWVIGKRIDHYASGKLYRIAQPIEVLLWCPPDVAWTGYCEEIQQVLDENGICCDFLGVEHDAKIDRHCASFGIVITEDWPSE